MAKQKGDVRKSRLSEVRLHLLLDERAFRSESALRAQRLPGRHTQQSHS